MATTTASGASGPETESHWTAGRGVPRRQVDFVRRLRAQRNLRAHYRRHVRDGRGAGAGDEDERHRLLVEEPGVFHEPLVQLQQRARAHAERDDGRGAGQSAR